MATADQYAEWIVNNADKRGTPEFDTVAQAYQLAKQEEAATPLTPLAPRAELKQGPIESLVRGFKSYVPQLKETIGGLGVLAGKGIQEAVGPGEVSAGMIKSGVDRMKAAEEQQQAMTRPGETAFTQALDKGIGTVLSEWLPYQVGSGAANLLESLALMGAGALAGTATAPGPGTAAGAVTGAVAKELAKKGVKEAVAKIAKEQGEEAAKKVFEKEVLDAAKAVAVRRGQTAFLAGQAAGYGFGQTAARAVEEAQRKGEAPESIDLMRVVPAGLVSTAAEFISDKIGLGALKGLKKETQEAIKDETASLLKKSMRVAWDASKGILVTGTKEAPTEIVQSISERFGAKLGLADAQAIDEYINAAAASYAMSVVPGAVGGIKTREAAPKPEAEPPKPEEEAEPAEAEAPKPVTGEAGIVRPEEETPISREVAKAAEPEVAPPAVISSSVPATKKPVTENYADMTVEALRSAKETADETNLQMDLSAIRKHFGEDAATAYAGMNRRQRNKWWDANATESFERDSSVFNGVNEETIDEYIQAYNKFDTESPQSLGRSIALIARKINDPDFIGSPEYLTLKNALSYAKEQGWSEKQVLDAMRGRASEWAGADAQELFKDLFKDVPKQTATTQTDSSLTKREELKALPPTVSPEPSIAEDRQRAEPVVEAAAPVEVTLYRGVPAGAEERKTVGGAKFMSPDKTVAESYAGASGNVSEESYRFNNLLDVPRWTDAKQSLGLPMSASMEDIGNAARNMGFDGVSFNTTNGKEYIVIDAQPVTKATKAQRTPEEQPAGEVRPEGRVQPEGEGRAAVSDEEARKINEQQAKDAGTPSNVTEAIEEHAFGKQMGAEPFTETRVKGHKAYITTGIRQAPNKELGKAIKDENTSGAIEQLLKSKNPIIAQIAKLASDRPLFGVGMMSYFPTLNIPKDATGVYDHVGRNILFKSKKWAESEHVVAHEMVHYLLWNAVESPTDAQKPAIQRLQKLFDHVKNTLGKEGQGLYALTNLQEFIAEANSNVNFQYKLRQIKYQNQTAWGAFTKFVSQILGLGNDTALSEIIALTEELASPESRTTGAAPAAMLAYEPEKQYRGQVGKETPPTPTTAGQQALDTINQLGMGVKAPEPGMLKKAGDALKRLGENPSGSKEEIKETIRKLFANLESKSFSSDARWESDIKKGMREDIKPVEDILGVSLLMSQSQAVGADAVSTRAMLIGGSKYEESIKKWLAYENKNANETLKARVLDHIAEKYGLTKEEASSVAHAYLVAANYEGIIARNAALEERIKQLKKDGKKDEADDLDAAIVFVSPEQAAMVEPGKAIANSIPEVKQITEIWNEQRRMVKDSMVFSGLWTEEYADALMDNAAYVPFYREPQVEADEGPKAMIRGLQVKAKEHKLKGSKEAVNDVFENMAMWQQYALNRAIRNHKALQSIDIGTTIKVGDRMMAEKVSEPKRGMNIVRVWRDGKQEFYSMADPYYVEAFQSLGSVYIEPIKYFSAISDMLRRSVVMYPLFSLGQIPQDAVAAIFASGLKPRYAFKIPFLAVREFVKTMRNTSKVHDELKNIGVVGIRDFNATIARQNAEITAGIKAPPGVMGKVKSVLEHVAMAADNAVRQSVYQASMDAGLSKAEAVEKAFEIINFRRRGSSKMLNLMGQTVPFFYAYLSAQRVAYRTITGTGISPQERLAALETLAMTSAAVMALSFIYAMANGGDEDYEDTPTTIRDRSIVIPGSGGVRIPLRPDFFLFPKVIAEHTYHLIAQNGFTDPAKFKKSMADLLANATLSPNVVPQVIKPTFEAAINYSFFEGKPVVGFFEKNKEASRQFNETTSEFGKFLGRFGASPQMVDHLARGYFGSVGGLFLWGTNFFIPGMPGVPRQDITWQDAVKTLPGVGAFKQKSTENALKVDFYELRDEVEKAKNTFDDIKRRSPEGLQDFINDEKRFAKLALEKRVTRVADELSKIRRAIQQVAAAPEDRFSAQEKGERIEELREIERNLLKAVDVRGMREQAMM